MIFTSEFTRKKKLKKKKIAWSSINYNCYLIHILHLLPTQHPSPKKGRGFLPQEVKKPTQTQHTKQTINTQNTNKNKKKPKSIFSIGSENKDFNSLEKTASFTLHHLKATIQDVPFHILTRASLIAASPQKD